LTHEEVEHAASRLPHRFLRKTQAFPRVSNQTISRITDKVIEETNDRAVRPLDEIYPASFIDAILAKVRCRQVGNRPIYAAMVGPTDEGRRAITDAAPAHTDVSRRYLIDLLDDDEITTMTDVLQRVLEGLDPQRDYGAGG
jgi:transposase-like protein